MTDDDIRRANAPFVSNILELERKQQRAMREHVLGDNSALGRIQVIDNQITALRTKLIPDA